MDAPVQVVSSAKGQNSVGFFLLLLKKYFVFYSYHSIRYRPLCRQHFDFCQQLQMLLTLGEVRGVGSHGGQVGRRRVSIPSVVPRDGAGPLSPLIKASRGKKGSSGPLPSAAASTGGPAQAANRALLCQL